MRGDSVHTPARAPDGPGCLCLTARKEAQEGPCARKENGSMLADLGIDPGQDTDVRARWELAASRRKGAGGKGSVQGRWDPQHLLSSRKVRSLRCLGEPEAAAVSPSTAEARGPQQPADSPAAPDRMCQTKREMRLSQAAACRARKSSALGGAGDPTVPPCPSPSPPILHWLQH